MQFANKIITEFTNTCIPAEKVNNPSIKSSMIEFQSGMIGGSIGAILSFPFDTIKTRIQLGIAPSFKQALFMGGLYRGISGPFFGIGFEKFIVFGFYGECKNRNYGDAISGLVAGFAASLVVVPVDRIKIIMQQKESIHRNLFLPSSLYKGFSITLFRETPGFGIYFTTYNKLANKFNQEKNLFKSFLFGSISGLTSWIFIYPSDLIKTKCQANKNKSTIPINKVIQNIYHRQELSMEGMRTFLNKSDDSINQIIKKIYIQDGFKGFYRGFSYALMRALPLHGGVFLGYEYSKKLLNI